MIAWAAAAGLAVLAAQVEPAAPACELHVFAVDLGGAPQPARTALVKPLPASSDPLAFINVMSPQDRMADVSDADYRRALGLAETTAIARHWDVEIPKDVRKSQQPLIATPGRCHDELIGHFAMGMMASRSRIGRDEVNVEMIFRDFAPDGTVSLDVQGSGYGAVDTEKKVGREAALQSLHTASLAIVDEFGKRLVKKRTKLGVRGAKQ